jgi:hypothetical protein
MPIVLAEDPGGMFGLNADREYRKADCLRMSWPYFRRLNRTLSFPSRAVRCQDRR